MPVTTRLSSKGQVIIPKQVREARGWDEGMQFVVEDTPDGILLKPQPTSPARARTTIDQVMSILKYDGPIRSIDEMDADVAALAAARWKEKTRRT